MRASMAGGCRTASVAPRLAEHMPTIETDFTPIVYEDPVRQRPEQRAPHQHFDRLEFALEALRVLRPARTRVAVFPSRRLEVQQGRDLGRGEGARWVMMGVPEDASPESIVMALTEIGHAPGQSYVMSVLLGVAAGMAAVN